MGEHIDREALIIKFKRLILGAKSLIDREVVHEVCAVIETFPTADVAEIKQGFLKRQKWIPEAIYSENGKEVVYEITDNEWWFENNRRKGKKTMNNYVCETNKKKNIYRNLCVIFAVIDCLLLCLICVIIHTETENPTQPIEEKPIRVVLEFEEQPEIINEIMCFDPITGNVYSCFERSDGNVQIRINPEGNRVILLYLERNVEE